MSQIGRGSHTVSSSELMEALLSVCETELKRVYGVLFDEFPTLGTSSEKGYHNLDSQ